MADSDGGRMRVVIGEAKGALGQRVCDDVGQAWRAEKTHSAIHDFVLSERSELASDSRLN